VESLRRRAHQVRIDLDAPHTLALVTERAGHADPLPTARRAGHALGASLGHAAPVLATGVTEGIVLLVPLEVGRPVRTTIGRIAEAFESWCEELAPLGALSVAISTACRTPADYVRGYAEARDLAVAMESISAPGRHSVTAVDCLGAGRMMILRPDSQSTQRFLRDTLGPLVEPADARNRDLLHTLAAFLRCGRNVRACARDVHVHENTIRYRLGRVQELLGVDVLGDAEAQLTLQMALTVRTMAASGERPRPAPEQGGTP
jgi:sugar diacid utilization regulator